MRSRHVVLMMFVLLAGMAASAVACSSEPERYGAFRETRTQEIPGTWGLMLSPPAEGYNPKLSPAYVLDRFAADTPREDIMLTLAELSSKITYVVDGTPHPVESEPAWVFMSRGICFNT